MEHLIKKEELSRTLPVRKSSTKIIEPSTSNSSLSTLSEDLDQNELTPRRSGTNTPNDRTNHNRNRSYFQPAANWFYENPKVFTAFLSLIISTTIVVSLLYLVSIAQVVIAIISLNIHVDLHDKLIGIIMAPICFTTIKYFKVDDFVRRHILNALFNLRQDMLRNGS